MSQNARKPILKEISPKKQNSHLPPKKLSIKIRQQDNKNESPSHKRMMHHHIKTRENEQKQDIARQQDENHCYEEYQQINQNYPIKFDRTNIQHKLQTKEYFRNSLVEDHWDESFRSILKSNQAYRKQLLSAYQQKVKAQNEKSQLQQEYINLQFQHNQLSAENKELTSQLAAINKNMLNSKQNHRKNIQTLEGDISRLKHQINLVEIDKDQMNKAYQDAINNSKRLQDKLSQFQEANRNLQSQIQELKGQISFLLGKINHSDQEYVTLQQNYNNSKKTIQNLQSKIRRNGEDSTKLINRLNMREDQFNQLKMQHIEEIQKRDNLIQQKNKQNARGNIKLKELHDQIHIIQQQSANLMSTIQSLKYLEQENINLRKLPHLLNELNTQNQHLLKESQCLIKENTKIKTQKEHIIRQLQNQRKMLNDVSKEYQSFIYISKAKEQQKQQIFNQQVISFNNKINDLTKQLQIHRQKNQQILKVINEKEYEANKNTELIKRLQNLTDQKVSLIQKQSEQGKKLKQNLIDKTYDTKQKKKKIEELQEILNMQRHKFEHIIQTNKCLLQQKQKCISTLNKQINLLKGQKEDQQLRNKQSIKRLQQKLRLQGKQKQLLKQKINQLELEVENLNRNCQHKQANIIRKQQAIRNLTAQNLSIDQSIKKIKQEVKELQQEKKILKEKQLQLNRALAQSQYLVESKNSHNQELKNEIEQLKRIREKQYTIQRQNSYIKYEIQKQFQEKYLRSQQVLKTVLKQFSLYKNQIQQFSKYNFSTLQKLVNSLNHTNKFNISRELQKIGQMTNKWSVISSKLEKSIQLIKNILQFKETNRNSILVKQGNVYKVNRLYSP